MPARLAQHIGEQMLTEATTKIQRLVVRGSPEDSPAVRLSVADLLRAADLRPSGLGPRAVLIVRRIGDPLPRSLSLRRVTPGVRRKWTSALQHSVDECRRRALCPAHDAVPNDADAVLFADEAELRACLIRDLRLGTAADRWWWRTWLAGRRMQAPAAAVLSVLMEAPRLAPGVLVRASQMVAVEEIVRKWTPEQIRGVIDAVLDAYRIPRALVDGVHGDRVDSSDTPDAGPPAAGSVRSGAVQTTRSLLRDRLPVLLMRIAAALLYRPGASEIQKTVEAWREESLNARGAPKSMPPALDDVAPIPEHQQSGEYPELRDSPVTGEGPAGGTPLDDAAGDSHPDGPTSVPDLPDEAAPLPPGMPVSDATTDADGRRPFTISGEDGPVASRRAPADSGESDAPVRADAGADEDTAANLPEFIETGLAGILYLAHVLDELDLPDAFEADWHLASDAGWWGTLELIAHGLLRGGDSSDPIWIMLASLAGRDPGDPVPSRLGEAPAFRVPEGWPSGTSWKSASPGSLEEGRGLQPVEPGPLCSGLPAPLCVWLRHVLPYVHLLLERRFAASPLGPPQPFERMLSFPARIFVTSTHVDVVAGLQEIDLHVRLAGLDRDPGWVPRAGRVIQFHFR